MGDLSPHFSRSELWCSHCLTLGPWSLPENVQRLEDLRARAALVRKYINACLGLPESPGEFPLPISSGYRCAMHPIEQAKIEKGGDPGEHVRVAIDSPQRGYNVLCLTIAGLQLGWMRIGWDQKGDSRIVHLDRGRGRGDSPWPWAWSY